jgi:hypothetical protein
MRQTEMLKLPDETTVDDTRHALDEQGADIAFVTSFGNTVGVITRAELDAATVEGTDHIGDLVVDEIVHVPPTADLPERIERYREAAWSSVRRRSPTTP